MIDDPKQLLHIYDVMVKSRLLEERLIKMFKQGNGFFWIGGPGEEAFNVPLGLHVKKGRGLDYDFMHLHYRANAMMLAMGMDPIEMIRQMANTITDEQTGGRNFCGHLSKADWNVVPITSPVETQYLTAIGTGIAHRDHGGQGITIVSGGDAGTAEGDFASCLVWASRPKQELPILMIVTNNARGISTTYDTQHGEKHVADRAKAFGIAHRVVDGNDVFAAFDAVGEAMAYVRSTRKPFLLEAHVSCLYGHSSASGANFQPGLDPIIQFADVLKDRGILDDARIKQIYDQHETHLKALVAQVLKEPMPTADMIFDHAYFDEQGEQ